MPLAVSLTVAPSGPPLGAGPLGAAPLGAAPLGAGPPLGGTPPLGAAPLGVAPLGAAPLGAGGGFDLTCSASQASNSVALRARTSNSMMLWPTPHSSAHWPRNVWPASDALTMKSNWFVRPGTTSRLNRNRGT